MLRRTASTFLIGIAIGTFTLPAATVAAAEPTVAPSTTAQTTCDATSTRGGAAGLVAAVVQAAANVCDVRILNDSVNNLLQNADIHVLQDIFNNSPILSYNDITVQNIDVSVLTGTTTITLVGGDLLLLTQ